jgi:hypothetical protein
LDATLVIAITFLGTTVAGTILPWRSKDVYEGSPIAKYKVPSWLGWLIMLVFVAGGAYLIYSSFSYGLAVLGGLSDFSALTQLMVIVVAILTIINAGVIVYLAYYVGKRVLAGELMPLVTLAGLIFFLFLDWLLIEWFWDPHVPPFDFPLYAIGWSNSTSMLFMIIMYALAAAIYFGFSAYRRRQGIDVSKVYQSIPVE